MVRCNGETRREEAELGTVREEFLSCLVLPVVTGDDFSLLEAALVDRLLLPDSSASRLLPFVRGE